MKGIVSAESDTIVNKGVP